MTRHIPQATLVSLERFSQFAPVHRLDEHTVVKIGTSVRLAEAETMKLVHQNTSIPVPEVLDAYVDEYSGKCRIVMEFVPGENLSTAWDKYSLSEKDHVIAQLRGYMSELRQIKGTFIGSVDGSWCNDHYFDNEHGGYGPFSDEAAFNEGIVRAMRKEKGWDWVLIVCDIFREVMTGHEIVLTHNDLDPRNILVRGSEVVALLDWELSGFYPEYWEYCKAMRRPDWESGWFRDRALERIIKPYRKELSVMWNTREIIW